MTENSRALSRKLSYGLLALLVVYAVVRSVFAAAGKLFWYDELMTLAVSAQGTWTGIVAALRAPLDGQPPLSYAFESLAMRFPARQEIALRLPSIIAFAFTLVCVFLHTKKKGMQLVGVVCACSLLTTALFHYYAIEARPYSVVVACFAFALVCYNRVPSRLWTTLFAIALATAQAVHYLAFLGMFPFGLAELVYSLRAKRIRWSVWVALGLGMLPLAIFWPLLSGFQACYGAYNWSRLYGIHPQDAYGEVLDAGWHKAEIIAAIGFVLLFHELYLRLKTGDAGKEGNARELSEITVVIGFMLVPFVGWSVGAYAHAGLLGRYVLTTVLGLVAGLGVILQRANRKWLIAVGVALAFVIGRSEIRFWSSVPAGLAEVRTYGVEPDKLIAESHHDDLPVVVPSQLVAVPVAHYVSPTIAKRLVFVTQDPDLNDPRYVDTADKELRRYQSYSPLRAWTYADTTNGGHAFLLLLSDRSHVGDWFPARLLQSNWSMRLVGAASDFHLYLMEPPRDDSASLR